MNSKDQQFTHDDNHTEAGAAGIEASAGGLFLSTFFAGCIALLLLIFFWLPAEYGVDFTSLGRTLGLTQMGELKENMHHHTNDDAIGLIHRLPGQSESVEVQWRDEYQYTLALSLIHISEPTRRTPISYAVFCLKKKKM